MVLQCPVDGCWRWRSVFVYTKKIAANHKALRNVGTARHRYRDCLHAIVYCRWLRGRKASICQEGCRNNCQWLWIIRHLTWPSRANLRHSLPRSEVFGWECFVICSELLVRKELCRKFGGETISSIIESDSQFRKLLDDSFRLEIQKGLESAIAKYQIIEPDLASELRKRLGNVKDVNFITDQERKIASVALKYAVRAKPEWFDVWRNPGKPYDRMRSMDINMRCKQSVPASSIVGRVDFPNGLKRTWISVGEWIQKHWLPWLWDNKQSILLIPELKYSVNIGFGCKLGIPWYYVKFRAQLSTILLIATYTVKSFGDTETIVAKLKEALALDNSTRPTRMGRGPAGFEPAIATT